MQLRKYIYPAFLWLVVGTGLQAQTIEIHQIDIGAGDATLIKVKNSARTINILLDAGSRAAAETVLAYLKAADGGNLGATPYLDYVIVSHYHEDHLGGFVGSNRGSAANCVVSTGLLSASHPVAYFASLDKGDASPIPGSDVFNDYRVLAAASPGRRITVGALSVKQAGSNASISPAQPANPPATPGSGQQLALGGVINLGADANGVAITLRLVVCDGKIYAPDNPNGYVVVDASRSKTNPNNYGLVWVLEYGKFRYFTGGDIGGEATSSYTDIETPMAQQLALIYQAPAGAAGHICAFKSDHHGSEHSTSDAFLQGLKPAVGIISCGTRHGHPTQDVITRMETNAWKVPAQAPTLAYPSITKYFMTELFAARNIDITKGSTSGSVFWIANPYVIPNPPATQSEQMANKAFLYYIPPNPAPVHGDIKLFVYYQDASGRRIDQVSLFFVATRSYQTGQWGALQTFYCHN